MRKFERAELQGNPQRTRVGTLHAFSRKESDEQGAVPLEDRQARSHDE
jgi:hypothetical protein